MSAAVIVTHTLPAQITALSAELVARRDDLAARADTVRVTTIEELTSAEALFVEIDRFTKQVAADRLTLTRPIDALKAQIIEAERAATLPLESRRTALARIVADFRAKVEAERREAERRAREEAERRAVELRQQQEAERQRQLAAWRAEQEAKRKQAEEEAALFGAAAPAADETPPPPPSVPAPVEAVIVPPSAPSLGRQVVRRQTRTRVVITDREALLAAACAAGGKIAGRLVVQLDEKAIEALVKAGVPVPGATTETYEAIGAAGGRG